MKELILVRGQGKAKQDLLFMLKTLYESTNTPFMFCSSSGYQMHTADVANRLCLQDVTNNMNTFEGVIIVDCLFPRERHLYPYLRLALDNTEWDYKILESYNVHIGQSAPTVKNWECLSNSITPLL